MTPTSAKPTDRRRAASQSAGVINAQLEQVNIADLLTHPRNARQGNIAAIRESIERNGFYGALIVQRSTRTVLDGTPKGADAIEALLQLQRFDYQVWDIDPYGSPFEALGIISYSASAPRIGIFLTDGILRNRSRPRGAGPLPKVVERATGWVNSQWLKAVIYYHYPQALRTACAAVLGPRWEIEQMAVMNGPKRPTSVNYACIIARRTEMS